MTALTDIGGLTVLRALHPVAARTALGTGTSFDVRQLAGVHAVVLDCAAGTGTTPTLDLTIQDSPDGTTDWQIVPGSAFAQVAAVASQQKLAFNISACRGFIRVRHNIGGTTPSFTFSVVMLGRVA